LVGDEKDRWGDKVRDAERGREEQYFAEQERKLLEKLRKAPAGEAHETLKQAAHMRCPKCGTHLEHHARHGVIVEECPTCHGMWLDAGELQKLTRREEGC
jgi:hypothetical protein